MLSIKQLAENYADRFAALDFCLEPQGLYEPIRHIIAIPGKHIRPLLVLLGCEAFGGRVEDAMPAAHAMELFHNFSLVHDDIMDEATLRRGVPTVHQKYGLNAGIMSGDALFIYAYKYICAVRQEYLAPVLDTFNATALEIMAGQQMDMDFEQRLDVSIDEYISMIGFKTSVLLACSLRIGAITGGATVEDQQRLYDFGVKLGLAFQIKDDWLDTFGKSEKVGKKAGGDIIQNKKTYLLITLLHDTGAEDKKALFELLGERNEDKKVTAIKALYDKYGISEKTSAKVDTLYNEALAALESVSLPEAQKANLYAMAAMMHDREF
jgi:geranylgeranyl diphosphate synthase type II